MHSNDRDNSNETVDYLNYDEESIGSSYSIGSNKKYPNNTGINYNNGLNDRLLLENKQNSIEKTSKYIFYLICLIISAFVSAIILFSIYYFTQDHDVLYYYAVICFFVTLILACCLCSFWKYRCELEKIQGPFISV
jgi:predicted membrane channel-forming protein YqfA (hemolysin III family)